MSAVPPKKAASLPGESVAFVDTHRTVCRSPDPKLERSLLAVREPGLTAKASYQEVARHLRTVKFDADSYITDKRATVEFRQQVAGVMARRVARIAPGSPMSGQEETDVGHSRFNHDQWR
jgi:hypothetical protein